MARLFPLECRKVPSVWACRRLGAIGGNGGAPIRLLLIEQDVVLGQVRVKTSKLPAAVRVGSSQVAGSSRCGRCARRIPRRLWRNLRHEAAQGRG